MEEVVLEATKRSLIGKQVKVLRREGKLPGIVYGRGVEPTPILLDLKATTQTLTGLPTSALVTVVVDGQRYMTLVREKQRDVLRGTLKHLDFQAVSATEKIRVEVQIVTEGVSPAVKELDGILVMSTETVMIECLPQDLLNQITIDISGLKEFGDSIKVSDLSVPQAVEILTDPEEVVAVVTAPAAEEEEEAVEEEAGEEPEVIERGKREEEEEE